MDRCKHTFNAFDDAVLRLKIGFEHGYTYDHEVKEDLDNVSKRLRLLSKCVKKYG